jgi:hypothetical protein
MFDALLKAACISGAILLVWSSDAKETLGVGSGARAGPGPNSEAGVATLLGRMLDVSVLAELFTLETALLVWSMTNGCWSAFDRAAGRCL